MSLIIEGNNVAELQKRINEINLGPIMFKLMDPEEGKGWSYEHASQVLSGYKVFLLLSGMYPGKSIVPTKDIDAFWHYHILDTQLYQEHCQYLFGKMLHHFPYFGMRSEEDRQALDAAFEETVVLFEQHGNMIDGFATGCGTGCGSSLCDNNACDTNSCTPTPGPDDEKFMPTGPIAQDILGRINMLMEVRPQPKVIA